jgi:hypothetical protein
METIDQNASGAKKRPSFLTVLCILTFIGAGLGLLGGLWSLVTAGATQKSMELLSGYSNEMSSSMNTLTDSLSSMTGGETGDAMNKSMDALGDVMGGMMESAMLLAKYAYILAAVNIIANLLCLLGALSMWKQKKTGYYMYVAGHALAIIIPMVLVGTAGLGGALFAGLWILGMIFPIAFIVMYGLNLKHMN